MRWLVVLVLAFSFAHSFAQEYRFQQYRVSNGLPSDVIKNIARDSLGFLWIASDEGIVKYDGRKFTTYRDVLNSQYAKSFLTTRDKRFLVLADLDLLEIRNYVDTVVFVPLLHGTRTPTDSTITFAKTLYEDRRGMIWIAEPQGVVRYDGKAMKRYDFGKEHTSPVFIRSFSFFEDRDGQLFAISFAGNVFRFDTTAEKFIIEKGDLPSPVSDVIHLDGDLLIATSTGVFKSRVESGRISKAEMLLPIPEASDFGLANDSTLWVSTYDENLYRVNIKGLQWTAELIPFRFSDINRIFPDENGTVWAATDKGVILVQPKLFELADQHSASHFVESITYDKDRDILYYCSKEYVLSIRNESGNPVRRVVYHDKSSYFLSVAYNKHGLWAANRSKVFLFQDDQIIRTWDFSAEGNFIADLITDREGNVWISQTGNKKVISISTELLVQHLDVPFTGDNNINIIREGNDGVYLGSNGADSYLYFKPWNKSFRNISGEPSLEMSADFNVNDLAIADNVIWVASNEGLFVFKDSTMRRVELGERFTIEPVRSVEIFDGRTLLFSNSNGLFRYDVITGEFWLYDENMGLPSNTITDQGIFVDPYKNVWVGTSYGLGFTDRIVQHTLRTPKLYCVETKVNGVPRILGKQNILPYGAFVDFQFTSMSLPEKIDTQWKFSGDSAWQTMENSNLSLANLSAGDYKIVVRAKGIGQSWSENSSIAFVVAKPYWQTAGFITAVIILVGLIAWISYTISAQIMERRKGWLQNLVNSRTHELQQVNEELRIRNTELDRFVYSASHDLSAPLKSLMGLINVARMEKPGTTHEQYLRLMERSVLKLDQFIREVVSYSRNSRMPLKLESFDFRELVNGILIDYQYSPNFKKIDFIVEDDTGSEMVCDVTRLKIILNNLISNTINFHYYGGDRQPYMRIMLTTSDGHYVIRAEDNGRGISQEHISKIFEMFYRASEESQGSGLGLYILKESVTKLDGTIEVTSVPNAGTIFTIRLPVRLTANIVRSTGT